MLKYVNLAPQRSHLDVLLQKINFDLKGGILIFIDNVPQGYKLSCCGSSGLDIFSFIQIALDHAVKQY